ncbi:hypothetical protein [Kitasatospora sp. NPDC004531]
MPARNRKLPRGLSWPLTPTDIRSALGGADDAPPDVTFCRWQVDGGSEVLAVEWLPELRGNYGGGRHSDLWETCQIWVYPLPSSRRAAAREALRAEALPALAVWTAAARTAPEGWRTVRRRRAWRVAEDGAVSWTDDPR